MRDSSSRFMLLCFAFLYAIVVIFGFLQIFSFLKSMLYCDEEKNRLNILLILPVTWRYPRNYHIWWAHQWGSDYARQAGHGPDGQGRGTAEVSAKLIHIQFTWITINLTFTVISYSWGSYSYSYSWLSYSYSNLFMRFRFIFMSYSRISYSWKFMKLCT